MLRHEKVKATLASLVRTNQPDDQPIKSQEGDKSHSDEDRSDEETPIDIEGQTGAARDLEFEIDPLLKLPKEEFIQEIEKRCGPNAE